MSKKFEDEERDTCSNWLNFNLAAAHGEGRRGDGWRREKAS